MQCSYGGSDNARVAGDLAYTGSHEALVCLYGRTRSSATPDFGLVGPYDVLNCRGVPLDADVDAFSTVCSADLIFGSAQKRQIDVVGLDFFVRSVAPPSPVGVIHPCNVSSRATDGWELPLEDDSVCLLFSPLRRASMGCWSL